MSLPDHPPCGLVARNAAQQELIRQLTALQEELRSLDKAQDLMFEEQRQRPDATRAEVLARSFISSRTNPFARHERQRRAVQNQYWKLVRLFYQLVDGEEDHVAADEAVIPSPAADEEAPAGPKAADAARTQRAPGGRVAAGHCDRPPLAAPTRSIVAPDPLQAACRPVAGTLLQTVAATSAAQRPPRIGSVQPIGPP